MHTTLDIYIQAQLERVLADAAEDAGAANRVCGVVMDVNTGAILAMATLPSYDLNAPYVLDEASLSLLAKYTEGTEEYRVKKNELLYSMWNNKAITETYEPGSTFKIITSAMGLEAGVITPEDPFHCNGGFRVGGVLIRCHKRTGHGSLNFATGLQQSCNPVFMQTAARIGVEDFYSYVQNFGYLEKTGIDLPSETKSIFHALSNIHEVELATAAFGQRFNISVIQQITGISAVANGGTLLTPHLLQSFTNAKGESVLSYATRVKREVVSEKTCQTVSSILEAGVSGGGGAKNAYVSGYKIAAKTGTSEKLNGGRVGSCVAYAPADDPKIAVIIMVDEPTCGMVYGSVVAAPYVSDLLSNVLPYLGYTPVYTAEEQKTMQIQVGHYVGLTKSEAAKKIRELGLTPVYADENGGDTITAQVPAAGCMVTAENGRVILYTGGTPRETVKVPELLGKTAAEANALLLSAGLNIRIEGAKNYKLGSGALVVAVSHAAGEYVAPGSVITVTFRHLDADESG
jgi:stage V sporulation protein D (sporulation-specific penicillin-binding protein)